ncbi:MAG: IS3 family transposase [Saccharofermentanales bacterium]|jgi:putative transposase
MELRQENPEMQLSSLLEIADLPKSSFYEWTHKWNTSESKDAEMITAIRNIIEEAKDTYGYRRVTIALKKRGCVVNHKRVLRIMKENNLLCQTYGKKNRKYSSYKGKVGKIADNKLKRDFKADSMYEKWVTDVTEFKLPGIEQKLFLSPIMDLYNREIVSFSLSTSPSVKFTKKALQEAIKKLPAQHDLTIHSDQGFQYQHKAWTDCLEQNQIEQSMSRKGNCIDNSPMENFFGLLKQEMFYGVTFQSITELKRAIQSYINWYNHKRIKVNLNGMSPVEYRKHAA